MEGDMPPPNRFSPSGPYGLRRSYLHDLVITALILITFTAVSFALVVHRVNPSSPNFKESPFIAYVFFSTDAWLALILSACISCFYWAKDRGSQYLMSGTRTGLAMIACGIVLSLVGLLSIVVVEIIWATSFVDTSVAWWWYLSVAVVILALLYMAWQNYKLIQLVVYYYAVLREQSNITGGGSRQRSEAERAQNQPGIGYGDV